MYNVSNVTAEKIYAKDLVFLIEQYLSHSITKQTLVDWVNIIWFTDLYYYNHSEEDSISSVMTFLENLDENDVIFSNDEFTKMIDSLKSNSIYVP